MGQIAVHEFVTLDGVFETPSWTFGYPFDPRMGEAIRGMNETPKYVVSATLEEADWNNSTVLGRYDAGVIRELKDQTDGSIYVSGSGLPPGRVAVRRSGSRAG